ncbi:ABC transporter substrate-binding protein [Streptomyces zagrosensis]|uniref:Uncharacterized protein n=1 Tax=Streptomyces zagrosensis TaxID=1042984 RepID=A0A7W9V0X4_9ACTN|nr:ABC transporter substrate-binding protein [Streptomyces zagrosensis]MBB5938688.1 hypothetical protein [Streptomyces zagrosensis]
MAETTFPDDAGADDFAREYPGAIAPADRRYLAIRAPLLLLRLPAEAPGSPAPETYRARTQRVVAALREPLREEGGKRVPYAAVEPTRDDGLVAADVSQSLAFGVPRHMTPDRFPDSDLMRDLVSAIQARGAAPSAAGTSGTGVQGGQADQGSQGASASDPQATGASAGPLPGPVQDAIALRDYAYQCRVARGGLPKALWSLGGTASPGGGGLWAWMLQTFWLSFTRTLPRWWWARRVTRRLIRGARPGSGGRQGWLGAELNVTRSREGLFPVMNAVAGRQAIRLEPTATPQQREQALAVLDHLLALALLADLSRPQVGGLLPKRRRRTARPVVLIQVPYPGEPGARAAERFLTSYYRARADIPSPGPLVIAVGHFSDALLSALGNPQQSGFSKAGQGLREGAEHPILVGLREESLTQRGLPIGSRAPRGYLLDWRVQTALVTGSSLLASSLAVSLIVSDGWLAPPTDSTCVVGDATVPQHSQPPDVHPLEWYETVRKAIDAQNSRAEDLAKRGKTVRTVVYFTSAGPESRTQTLFDGIVPELRGIVLWQRRLNDEAFSDDSRVPLRVEVRNTGRGFVHAPEEAKKLVQEVRAGNRTGAREIVGVLGYAQSRDVTRQALRILAEARIPAVGTTATADEMQVGDYYWPLTPVNSTEARITASFARYQRLVARPSGDGCTPARRAIVVQSSDDLYSRSLAGQFIDGFANGAGGIGADGAAELLNFSQDGDFSNATSGVFGYSRPSDLAAKVCETLNTKSPTVVYWAARTRDFTAFVNALDARNSCNHEAITVLAGNELTNVAQTGEFEGKSWLRLYYSAHRLPDADDRASRKTKQFVATYNQFVAGQKGRDPWRNDGQAAVAYDALHVLSQAVDLARADTSVGMSAVSTALRSGIAFEGATGTVSYAPGSNAPPRDKTLVVLRLTPQGPRTAVACGAYAQGQRYADQGVPCAR